MHEQYLLFADETTHFKLVKFSTVYFFPFQDSNMYLFLNMVKFFSKRSQILHTEKGRLFGRVS